MREHRCRRRVGEIVGRHVDRLHRGHRALARGGDALLQLAHLGLERRLVADLRGHAPEQCRDLGARLHEAEDVVDEQQHVLTLVAEVFGHRQTGEGDPHACSRGLVHLPEHEHRLVEHARLLHLEPQVVALAGTLAHAAERRQPAVFLGEVVDELLDQHCLAHASSAEQPDLATLGVGGEQVDDLDPRLEHLGGRRQVLGARCILMDAAALGVLRQLLAEVDRFAQQVEDASERRLSDRHRDRAAGVDHLGAARQAVGRVHRDRTHAVVAEVLLDLAYEHLATGLGADALGLLVGRGSRAGNRDRMVDLRQAIGEHGLDHDALDLLDAPEVARGGSIRCCGGLCGGAGWH